MRTSVAIVDSGLCNLDSIRRALQECGAAVRSVDQISDLLKVDKVVLPGVGAFGEAIHQLERTGMAPALRDAVDHGDLPILGICLGMHLLFERSDEAGEHVRGLGAIAGEVRKLVPGDEERVPHVGWNEVQQARPSRLLDGVPSGSDFYFVHSYHACPSDAEWTVATTPYCGSFASVVAAGSVFGVQFHPEKSQQLGLRLLGNFLAL